jgi:hypothetical protein
MGFIHCLYANHNLRIISGIRGRFIPHKECQESKEQSSHPRTKESKPNRLEHLIFASYCKESVRSIY